MAKETASGRDQPTGWTPLRKPPRGAVGQTPFSRLAIAHCAGIAGDTLVTMALAGSLFFSISPSAARGRVAAYLLLTMAPFAVVAPLLGPVLDRSRGGRRTVMILSAASRALASLSMAKHLNGPWLFPEAFVLLVLSKTQMVTKSALVPSTVSSESELVEANSRLAVLSVIAGFVAAVPGVLVLKLGFLGAPWVLRLAAVMFAAAAVAGTRITRPPRAKAPIESAPIEKAELHATTIRLSVTAMAVLRAVVGFMTFLVAFDLRHQSAPAWWFGVVLAASMVGNFIGAAVAPWLRKLLAEERILLGALALVTVVGFVAARAGGLAAIATLAGVIGVSAGAGKLAFDSIVQRDAPDAVRGRTFARFETRFQLVWVLGAAVPVIVHIPATLGMDLIAAAGAVAFATYVGGLAASHRRG
ncbi:MAG: MFS transporter [Actinobacteria bacterium]|nr:MFS transporter [Actinomycetota bacterium]